MSFGLVVGFFILVTPTATQADMVRQIPFSARLKGASGDTIAPDGSYSVTFSIYTVETAGTAAWSETQTVSVKNGLMAVNLGSVTAIPSSLSFNDDAYYLGIKIGSDAEMSPRKRIASVPMALNADSVGGAKPGTGADNVLKLDSSGNINIAGSIATTGTLQAGSSTLSTLTVDTTTLVTDATNNRVGIGLAAPDYPLDVVGDINTSTQLRIGGNVVCTSAGCSGSGGAASFVQGGNSYSGQAILGTNDSNSLAFETAGTTRMTLDTSGQLGLGIASPQRLLHLYRDDNTTAALRIDSNRSGSGGHASRIELHASSSPAAADKKNFQIVNINTPGGTTNYNVLQFRQIDDALSTNVGLLALTHGGGNTAGSVLIGTYAHNATTAGPSNGLAVSGNVGIGTDTGINSKLTFAAGTTAADGILFGTDTNLYRSAADTLKTDDSLVVGTNLTVQGTLSTSGATFNPGFTTGSVAFQGASGLTQDNTNYFWDDTNDRLGIGTNSPGTELHISKGLSSGVKVRVQNTTTDTAAFSQISALATSSAANLYALNSSYTTSAQYVAAGALLEASGAGGLGISALSSSGVIRFHTNTAGAERMRIDASGNLGIGTTTGIDSKLTFAADTTAAGGILFGTDVNLYRSAANQLRTDDNFRGMGTAVLGTTNTFHINPDFSATGEIPAGALINSSGSTALTLRPGDGSLGAKVVISYYNGTTNNSALEVGNVSSGSANLLLLKSGGNVGIGAVSPDRPLTIQGSQLLSFKNASGTTKWHINDNSASGNLNVAETGVADGRLLLEAGGNVGIGTTDPNSKLDVNGVIAGIGIQSTATITSTGNSTLPAAGGGQIYWAGGYSSPDAGRFIFGDGTGWKMHLSQRTGSTTTDVVTFQDNGNIGIGTSSNINSKLTFAAGTTAADGILFGTDTNLYRATANILRTDDALYSQRASATDVAFLAYLSGDTTGRFYVEAGGKLLWGDGSVSQDTNLYRSAADVLKTDDSFVIGGSSLTIGSTQVCTSSGCVGAGGAASFVQGGNSFSAPAVLGTNDSNSLAFETAGTTRITLDTAGDFGIGTTDPQSLLHVGAGTPLTYSGQPYATGAAQANVAVTSGEASTGVSVSDGTNNRRAKLFVDQTAGVWGLASSYTTGGSPFVLTLGAIERIRVSSAGLFGVGTNNPTSYLHAVGAQPASVSGNGTASTQVMQITGGKGGDTSGTTGQTAGAGAAANITSGAGGDAPSGSTNGNGGLITLQGGAAGAGAGTAGSRGNIAMQASGGNVGIGTASPSNAKLQIDQTFGSAALSITGSGGGTTGLVFATGNYGYIDYDSGSAGMRLSSINLAPMLFGFNTNAAYGASTFSEAMRIKTDGFVGIGTNNPDRKLQVNGDINLTLGKLYFNYNGGVDTSGIVKESSAGNIVLQQASTADIQFKVWDGAANQYAVLRSSGNFGIGTTTPTSLLHAIGSQPASVSGSGTNATAALTITGGQGGNTSGTTGQTAGVGAVLNLTSGAGGDAPSGSTNGNGGLITLQGGASGAGAGTAGSRGNIALQASGGNVGIGTASPARTLHVVGTASNGTAITRVSDGTVHIDTFIGAGSTNAQFGTVSNHPLYLFSNNAINFTMTAPGNIGVGVTSPTSKFHVVGAQPGSVSSGNGTAATQVLQITGGTGGNTTDAASATGGAGAVVGILSGAGGDAPSGSTNGNGGLVSIQGGAPGAGAGTAGSYGNIAMQAAGGSVGVGVSSGLAYKVHVQGSGNNLTSSSISIKNTTDGTAAGGIINVAGGTSNAASGFFGAFSNTYSNNTTFTDRVGISTNSDAVGLFFSANGASQDIRFHAGSNAEAMRIDSSGRLGVGATTVATKMEVSNGTTSYWGQTTAGTWGNSVTPAQALTITNSASGGYDPVLLFRQTTSTGTTKTSGAIDMLGSGSWDNADLTNQVSAMLFITRDTADTLQERMRITHDGKVGIGTTVPGATFDVKSTATNEQFHVTNNTQYLYAGANSSDYVNIGGFKTGTGAIPLALQTAGGNVGIGLTSNINSKLTFAAGTTAADGILFGTDTNLYRAGADILRSDDAIYTQRASASDVGFLTYISGDSSGRLNITADGTVKWGPGNAAQDVNLYRSAADTLKTDDSFAVVANFTLDGKLIITPSATQTLAAGDPILANAAKVKVAGSGGAVTLTSTPTIADGTNGQLLYIQGTDDTNTLTVQDQGSLASSNLELGAATRLLGKGDGLVLTFDSTDSVWYEISFTNN